VSQAHQQKPGQQVEGSSWQRCKLQTFFAEKQHIRYFVIRGLDKDQIQASFALPKKDSESEPELVRILAAMHEVLGEAHGWCADGPECMLTWPRQLALGRFYTAVVGKARGFEPKKEPQTLLTYFGYWKQFLAYYYRVVHRGGHFTPPAGGTQRTPADFLQLTEAQRTAWAAVVRSAAD
jgi:hypothetical protein